MPFSWSAGAEEKKPSVSKAKAKGFSWSVSGAPEKERRPRGSGPKTTEERLSDVEGAAAEAGYEPPGRLKSLGMNVLDLLSRGNYAAAGASEELFTEAGGGPVAALKRAGREIFSGIGGVSGDKESFAQVMEQAGVGTGGSLSDIAPSLYSETGEGLALKRGGALDPTARGAGGLALDIIVDPLNLVGAAAGKGITVAGKSVPLTRQAAALAGRASSATIKAMPGLDKALDAVGGVFNRDWKIRNLPGAVRLKQAHLNRHRLATQTWHEELGRSSIAAIPRSKRAAFVDAMDDGTWTAKYADDPEMLKAAQDWKEMNQKIAVRDIESGELTPDKLRTHYVAHFYENSNEELAKVLNSWPKKVKFDPDTIGRHQELRAFDTMREAEEWTKAQHAIDPNIPILRPLRDPLEIMRRRGEATIDAAEFRQYYGEIKARFGRDDVPISPEEFEDLTKAWKVSDSEAATIGNLVSSGKATRESLDALTKDGRREFMRQTLLGAKSPEEVVQIMSKYGVENAPQQTRQIGKLAPDGSVYKSVKLGNIEAEIPQSLANDIADMSERVFRSREFNHLVRYYDKINNTFRAFVTIPFPAFHFRNAYSNLSLAFADVGASVLNPARHYDAYAALRALDGNLVTKAGEAIPYKQIHKEMAENGVMMTGRELLEYTGQHGVERLGTVTGKVRAFPRKVGQTIENEARAALYTVYRRRGDDAVRASERVNEHLFDYTNLSYAEQKYFKRMIPFYTFMRKNLERQFRNITTKPGLTAAQLKVVRGRPEENENMTTWEGNAFKFRLNKDGKTLTALSGVDLPFRQLDLIWRGSIEQTGRQGIGMLSPILQSPLVMTFGQVPFTGRSTERAESAIIGRLVEKMPVPMQKWIGYDKEVDDAGRPRYTFQGDRFYALFQSWALSRVVSTTDRQFRTLADDPSWGPVLLDTMTGLRMKQINLDEEKQRMYAERLRYLEKWGRGKGFLRKYESTYVPKEK